MCVCVRVCVDLLVCVCVRACMRVWKHIFFFHDWLISLNKLVRLPRLLTFRSIVVNIGYFRILNSRAKVCDLVNF